MSERREGRGGGGAPARRLPTGGGFLLVVSAPSGAGKTTVIRGMMADPPSDGRIEYSVSFTTRPPRPGERDGRDYRFVEVAEFERRVEAGEMLEWASVHGNLYGTAYSEVLPRLEGGIDVLLEIDVQGARQVLEAHPEAVGVFLLPPSYRDLEERLLRRGADGPEGIRRRLSVSRWEIERYDLYDYVMINRDAERSSRALAAIVIAERHRRQRRVEEIEEILRGFPHPQP